MFFAARETRTPMGLLPLAPEASASANFAIAAQNLIDILNRDCFVSLAMTTHNSEFKTHN